MEELESLLSGNNDQWLSEDWHVEGEELGYWVLVKDIRPMGPPGDEI